MVSPDPIQRAPQTKSPKFVSLVCIFAGIGWVKFHFEPKMPGFAKFPNTNLALQSCSAPNERDTGSVCWYFHTECRREMDTKRWIGYCLTEVVTDMFDDC